MKKTGKQKVAQFAIVLSLLSCGQNNKEEPVAQPEDVHVLQPEAVKTGFSGIKLVDPFNNTLRADTAHEVTVAMYSPVYLGPILSSLHITYNPTEIGSRTAKFNQFEDPDSSSLSILIDTTRTIGSPMDLTIREKVSNYRDAKAAYPVVLLNLGKDTLTLGASNVIPLIMEAKDRSGKWRPIQKDPMFTCGTGSTEFYLPPNQMGVTTMKQYSGNFKTKLRLAFYYTNPGFYSNEIVGFINEAQFETKK